MNIAMPLSIACLSLSLLACPAAIASSDVQNMEPGRLNRVARVLGLEKNDFLAAIELDRDLLSFNIDADPWAAAQSLADRVEQEIDRLIEEGSWSEAAALDGRAVALDVDEGWQAPLGLNWLSLDGATVVGSYDENGSLSLSIVGFAQAGGVPTATSVSFDADDQSIRVTSSIETLTLGEIRSMLEASDLPTPFAGAVSDDALAFENVTASFTYGDETTFSLTGTTWLNNAIRADALFSLVGSDNAQPQMILGLRVHEWTLAEMFHGLHGTVAAEVRFPEVAFTIAQEIGEIHCGDLDPAAIEFYRPVLGDNFTLELDAGIAFDGMLPLSRLPADVVAAMGMNKRDAITVEGSLDLDIELFGRSSPIRLNAFALEAALPAARDMRLPASLRSMYTIERTLRFEYADDVFTIGVASAMHVQIDGGVRTFDLEASATTGSSNDSLRLSGSMRDTWHQPFGLEWLTLDDVRVQTVITAEGVRTVLNSTFEVAGKAMGMRVVIAEDAGGQRQITLRATVDQFNSAEIRAFIAHLFPNVALFQGESIVNVPFRDIVMTMDLGESQTFSLSATTMVRGQEADVMLAAVRDAGETDMLAAFRLDAFELVDAFPALHGSLVDELDLSFPGATIVVSSDDMRIDADTLGAEARKYFRESCKTNDFDFNIGSGVNLVSTISLPKTSITDMLSPLGIGGGREHLLTGTLPSGFLSGSASGLLSDLSLRIALPPMTPPNAPQWFVSAQLAVEITGQPSLAIVGEMTVDIEGDELTFFVEGSVARTGAGVSLALVGGLSADEPWQSPFGIHWLTFNDARIKLSISATGSLGLGFAGDMVIGDKDIDTAVFIAVNMYTGVPTNFIFEGRSEAGVSLSDLVKLQHRMLTLGLPIAPPINLDRLPDVSIRNLHLKFAPMDEPDLGVERGFIVQGECWAKPTPMSQMIYIGGVSLSIDESGIVGSGSTGNITLGPVHIDSARTSLTLMLGHQEFSLNGLIRVGGRQMTADIELTREGLNGEAITQALEDARAALEAARARIRAAFVQARWPWN